MVRRIALIGSCVIALQGGVARAHVCMDVPVSRAGEGCTFASPQKVGPCGVAQRGDHVTTFRPGQKITVELNETIDHPSHYRIAFNPDGDDFEDPTSVDDDEGGHPYVLLDGIVDEDAARQTIEVTLPDVTCDSCTLQLIQVMYDKGGNGFGGNDGVAPNNDDLYYACADLVLAEDAPADAGGAVVAPRDGGVDAGRGDAGGGRSDAGKSDAGAAPVSHDQHDDEPQVASDAASGCQLGRSDAGGWGAIGALFAGLVAAHLRRRRRAI